MKKTLFRQKTGAYQTTLLICLSYDLLEDGSVVLEKSELPIKLPDDIDQNSQGNPLENHSSWKHTKHKNTGKKAYRNRYS